jgi:hypothetical protein
MYLYPLVVVSLILNREKTFLSTLEVCMSRYFRIKPVASRVPFGRIPKFIFRYVACNRKKPGFFISALMKPDLFTIFPDYRVRRDADNSSSSSAEIKDE